MGRFLPLGLIFILAITAFPGLATPKEKEQITLPEIVIKGVYTPSYRDIEGVKLTLDLVASEKKEPKIDIYGIGKDLFEKLRREETTPKTPGCAYRHGVTSFFAKAFKGEVAYYKRGSYFYRKGEYNKALENFREVTTGYPESKLVPPAEYWEGECLFHMKKKKDALSVWESCCKRKKGEFVDYACYSAGWINYNLGNYDRSYFYLNRVLKNFPKSPIYPESLILASLSLYRSGKVEEAAELLEKKLPYIEKDRAFARASFGLGIMCMDLGRFKEAEAKFSDALRSTNNPELIKGCLINRGFSKLKLGDVRGGLSDFTDARKAGLSKDEDQVALFGILSSYIALGEYRKAEATLNELSGTRLYPTATRIYAKHLADVGRFDDAIRAMERLQGKLKGEDYFFLGYIFYRAGDMKMSLLNYKRALLLGYRKNESLYNVGLVLYKMGNLEGSYNALSKVGGNLKDKASLWMVKILLSWEKVETAISTTKAIKDEKLKLKAASMVGEYLIEHGRWKEAKDFLKPYTKEMDKDPYPSYLLAEAMFNLRDYPGCISIAERLSKTTFSKEKICILDIKARLELGKAAEALKNAELCLKEGAKSPTLLYLKGEALYRMGRYKEAVEPYREALKLGLEYPQKLDAYLKLYNAYMNLGMREKALSTLLEGESTVKHERPDLYSRIYYQITDFYYETKNYDYFLARAKAFLNLFPHSSLAGTVRVMLGDYYSSKGDVKTAESTYKPILKNEKNPSRFVISLSLAEQFRAKKMYQRALEYYRMSLSSKDQNIKEEAMLGMIKTFFAMGDNKKCYNQCSRFLKLFPKSPRVPKIKYMMGVSEAKLGKTKEGIKILEGLASNPKTPKDVATDSLKFLVSLYERAKNKKMVLNSLNKLIPLLSGTEKAKYHLLKCRETMDPTECVRVSYIYSSRSVISKALLYAATAYYKRKDINSLKKVLRRAERVGNKDDVDKIKRMVKKLENQKLGGRR